MNQDNKYENITVITVPFLKDLEHPEKDCQDFLENMFKKLC